MLVTAESTLSSEQQAYIQQWMKKVSRSFAMVTPFLEKPLDQFASTAYLICRVVDNIEDCGQSDDWKDARFEEFVHLLEEPTSAHEVLSDWGTGEWLGLTRDEQQMMSDAEGLMLWEIYSGIPYPMRQVIRQWVTEMAHGMQRVNRSDISPCFVSRWGIELTAAEADYNEYCYYVAGTVGYLITELAVQQYELSPDLAAKLMANSQACGHGLQKTNILKDFTKDLKRGISYLPDAWMSQADHRPLLLEGAPIAWTRMVIGDVLRELQGAVTYTLDLPHKAGGYRTASLLCLFPAYQTLLQAAKKANALFTDGHIVKISRQTMYRCLRSAKTMALDDVAIGRYSQQLHNQILTALGT